MNDEEKEDVVGRRLQMLASLLVVSAARVAKEHEADAVELAAAMVMASCAFGGTVCAGAQSPDSATGDLVKAFTSGLAESCSKAIKLGVGVTS